MPTLPCLTHWRPFPPHKSSNNPSFDGSRSGLQQKLVDTIESPGILPLCHHWFQAHRQVPVTDGRFAVALVETVTLRFIGQFRIAATMSKAGIKGLKELALSDCAQLGVIKLVAMGRWALSPMFVGDFTAATVALHHAIAAALGRIELVLCGEEELPALDPLDTVSIALAQAELRLAGGNASGAAAILTKLPAKNFGASSRPGAVEPHHRASSRRFDGLGPGAEIELDRHRVAADLLRTVARLHRHPCAETKPDPEKIVSILSALNSFWLLALLPVSTPSSRSCAASTKKLGVSSR